jgi:hypothetical protein
MTDYACPNEITKVFDSDPERGRQLAVDWFKTVDLQIGDRVWMPEVFPKDRKSRKGKSA